MTLAAGVGAALRGLGAALGARDVRRAYLQLVLAIFLLAAGLEVAGLWGVWEWTRPGDESGWVAVVGLVLLRIAGIVIVLLAAPLLSILLANLAFPMLGERVFMAGLRNVAPARATELAAGAGLPVAAGVGVSLRRLLSYVVSTLLVLGLSLVPVVGALVAPWLQAYLTARVLGWELLDPYFDRRGLDHAAQRAFLRDHGLAVPGFALPYSFLMAVPLVGPLFFGLAQAAAATLVVDVLERD